LVTRIKEEGEGEGKVLRRLFEPKRDEVIGDMRKLHTQELHHLYSSPKMIRIMKSRRMRWARHVAPIGKMRNFYTILVQRKRPLARHRRRWEDNIKMDVKEIGWEGVDWIHVVQDTDQWRTQTRQ
jgi:hypothetical protein